MNIFEVLGNTYVASLPIVACLFVLFTLILILVPLFRLVYAYINDVKVDHEIYNYHVKDKKHQRYYVEPLKCLFGKKEWERLKEINDSGIEHLFVTWSVSILLFTSYPIVLVCLFIFGIIKLLRFVVRTRKYLNKHTHIDGKCTYIDAMSQVDKEIK